MQLTLELKGIRPMLHHNVRLANPLDPYTRKLKAVTGKKGKTDDDLIEIMQLEARGGIYETADGYVGVPTQLLWSCILNAARAYKKGMDIQRALMATDEVQPLLIKGKKVKVAEFLKDPSNIDYRPVRVQGKRTMRARPIVRDWSCVHHFEFLDDVMDAHDLIPILERAGRLVGLGDWRPLYGTFSCEVSNGTRIKKKTKR